MQSWFLASLTVGGLLVVLQFGMGLLGLDDGAGVELDAEADVELDGGAGGAEGLHLLSVRTLSAGLAFFGIAGMASLSAGAPRWLALAAASATGIAAAVAVAAATRAMLRLQSDGTVRIAGAVGTAGTVYLRIPARRAGEGKVTLTVQGRTVEFRAVTDEDELPTGSRVIVVDVAGPATVEVAREPDLRQLLSHR